MREGKSVNGFGAFCQKDRTLPVPGGSTPLARRHFSSGLPGVASSGGQGETTYPRTQSPVVRVAGKEPKPSGRVASGMHPTQTAKVKRSWGLSAQNGRGRATVPNWKWCQGAGLPFREAGELLCSRSSGIEVRRGMPKSYLFGISRRLFCGNRLLFWVGDATNRPSIPVARMR